MSNIKRILTVTQECAETAIVWALRHYFSYIPDDAPEDFDDFCERFEAGELPEALVWEPFENYAEAQIVEWVIDTRDSIYNMLIDRATRDGAIK